MYATHPGCRRWWFHDGGFCFSKHAGSIVTCWRSSPSMNRFTATSLQNAWLNEGDHRAVFTQPRPGTVVQAVQQFAAEAAPTIACANKIPKSAPERPLQVEADHRYACGKPLGNAVLTQIWILMLFLRCNTAHPHMLTLSALEPPGSLTGPPCMSPAPAKN